MHVLDEIKEFKVKNKIPVVAGGVFCTFAPDLCIKYSYVDMDSIDPNKTYVRQSKKKKFISNGTKFQSGDILFATMLGDYHREHQ